MRIKQYIIMCILIIWCFCGRVFAETGVCEIPDCIKKRLADRYIEATILYWESAGTCDGRPTDDEGVYVFCLKTQGDLYYMSIFEKDVSDKDYHQSGESALVLLNGVLPDNISIELVEDDICNEYVLTYGYSLKEIYLQVEFSSVVGSKEWKVCRFSAYDDAAQSYDLIELIDEIDNEVVIYRNIPYGISSKEYQSVRWSDVQERSLTTNFNDIDMNQLLMLFCEKNLVINKRKHVDSVTLYQYFI